MIRAITSQPPRSAFARFSAGTPPRFMVTVDTEEEFDWSQPIRREGYSLHSVTRLARFQEFCEGAGVIPVYLVDYPIATSPAACEALRPAIAAGRAEVGV